MFPLAEGNPYLPMNIIISDISIDGLTIQDGDEIAVFDNDLLVGAGVISTKKNAITDIVAAMDDPLTSVADGFVEGNFPLFRYKSASLLRSIPLQVTPVFGSAEFSTLGTFVCTLHGSITDLQEEKEIPVGLKCIPNPASNYSSIVYNMPEEGQVLLEVFDLSGRRIKVLQNEMVLLGRQQYRFDVGVLKNGVYIIKFHMKLKSGTYAEIIKFVKN
jgi:hypothetical protein